MKKYRFRGTIAGKPAFLARLDKRRARSLFELGGTVYLVPDKLNPFNQDLNPLPISLDTGKSFESLAEQFKNYFCLNSNTGYFPAFYVDLLNTTLNLSKNEAKL